MNIKVVAILFLLFSSTILNAETIKGEFTRGFERYDLTTNGKNQYFIEDPKNLIQNLAINKKYEKSFWASFPLCVEGKVSKKGGYGPSGKYSKKIRITRICK